MNLRDPSAPALDGLIERLQLRLNARATAATREWWAKYLRGAASFRGVKMGDVRTAVHAWFEEEKVGEQLSVGDQKDLALMLLGEATRRTISPGYSSFRRSSYRQARWTGTPTCPGSRASSIRGISGTGTSSSGWAF